MNRDPMSNRFLGGALIVLALALAPAAAAQPGEPPQGQRLPPRQLIGQFDRNGDGKLNQAEAPPPMVQHWSEVDANADGFVTCEELTARFDGPGPAPNHEHPVFSVIVLGSGGPPYNPARSGPSVAIQHRGRFVIVDMGNGTVARMHGAGISWPQIDALLFTHHHRDHDEEFMPMLNSAIVHGRTLDVAGPPGTARLTDFTLDFYAQDLAYRLTRTGRKATDLRKPRVRELQGGESFTLGALQVKTVRVPHSLHTVAYRFEAGGRSIVISGDLEYSSELIALAAGADVLILDAGGSIALQGELPPARRSKAELGQRHLGHVNLEDVRRMAQGSHAKRIVLTHIGPGDVDEEATIAGVREVYEGEVTVASDLLEVAPANP